LIAVSEKAFWSRDGGGIMTAKTKIASLTVPMTPDLHAMLGACARWRGCSITEAAQEAIALYCGGGAEGGGLAEAVIAGHARMAEIGDSLRVLADFIASAAAADSKL
jgi:hypothetical protein